MGGGGISLVGWVEVPALLASNSVWQRLWIRRGKCDSGIRGEPDVKGLKGVRRGSKSS